MGSEAGLKSFHAEDSLKPQLPTSLAFGLTAGLLHKSSGCFESILTTHYETHQREGMKKEGIKQDLRTSTICLL